MGQPSWVSVSSCIRLCYWTLLSALKINDGLVSQIIVFSIPNIEFLNYKSVEQKLRKLENCTTETVGIIIDITKNQKILKFIVGTFVVNIRPI